MMLVITDDVHHGLKAENVKLANLHQSMEFMKQQGNHRKENWSTITAESLYGWNIDWYKKTIVLGFSLMYERGYR